MKRHGVGASLKYILKNHVCEHVIIRICYNDQIQETDDIQYSEGLTANQ